MSKPEEITLAVRKERAWELLSYWRELGLSNAQFDVIKYIEDLEAKIVCLKAEVQEGVIRNDNLHRVFSAKYEECMQLKTEKEALEEAMKQAFKAARQEVAEGPFFSDRRLYPTFEDWQRSREK